MSGLHVSAGAVYHIFFGICSMKERILLTNMESYFLMKNVQMAFIFFFVAILRQVSCTTY